MHIHIEIQHTVVLIGVYVPACMFVSRPVDTEKKNNGFPSFLVGW